MSESYKNINNTELLRIKSFSVQICICLCTIFLSGCSYFISSATVDMTANLSQAISDNNDLATVEAGGPAFLLMVDSLLYRDPDNESLLRASADVYTVYTDVFVKDKDRAKHERTPFKQGPSPFEGNGDDDQTDNRPPERHRTANHHPNYEINHLRQVEVARVDGTHVVGQQRSGNAGEKSSRCEC